MSQDTFNKEVDQKETGHADVAQQNPMKSNAMKSHTLKQRLFLFIPLVVFMVLAFFFWRGLSLDPNAMPSALIDKTFPAFTLAALDNSEKTLTQDDLLGQVSLVNVWATWCVACKFEHPVLNQLAEQGIPIIGINYKDNDKAAVQWLGQLGNPYQFNIVDSMGTLGLDLGVFGAPETYIVDAQGVIRHKHVGIVDMDVWRTTLQPIFDRYSQ
jgi:cytochrome c biogenesis protein CcmG/thiol:disulfide interchange protein DsbE